MARKKAKKKGSKKEDSKKKNLKKKDIKNKLLKKKKDKKKGIKDLKRKEKKQKAEAREKKKSSVTVSTFSDHSSNYNVKDAISKLRSLDNQNEAQSFIQGEERTTITRLIPGIIKKLGDN
jgi:hypothetical protein